MAGFVSAWLPRRPERLLEIGCGEGELARELDDAGYDVLAIDPRAPDGPLFRRVTLEELDDPGPFAGVVAARSLHHVHDLPAALDKVVSLLDPDGVLLLEEFGWELFDERAAAWYGRGRPPDAVLAEWRAEHAGLHGFAQLRAELDRRFDELHFSWEPYLCRLLEQPAAEAEERALIESGAMHAIGFRYAGRRR